MTAVLMKRTLAGLTPDDDAAREALRTVDVGDVVRVDVQRPRSHKNLRRWWALMNLIAQNSDTVKSEVSTLREAAKSEEKPCPDCAEMTKQRDHYRAKIERLERALEAAEVLIEKVNSADICAPAHKCDCFTGRRGEFRRSWWNVW